MLGEEVKSDGEGSVLLRVFPTQDAGDDDHVVLARELLEEDGRRAGERVLGELHPRLLLARAEGKGHRPRLLKAHNGGALARSSLDQRAAAATDALGLEGGEEKE